MISLRGISNKSTMKFLRQNRKRSDPSSPIGGSLFPQSGRKCWCNTGGLIVTGTGFGDVKEEMGA